MFGIPARTHIVYTETSQMICNAKQLASFQTVHVFSERYFQKDINPFPANVPFKETISWFLQAKCLKNHLWKSNIIIKDAGRWSVSLLKMSLYHNYFLANFASKIQLYIWLLHSWNIEASAGNGFDQILNIFIMYYAFISHCPESNLYWFPKHVWKS